MNRTICLLLVGFLVIVQIDSHACMNLVDQDDGEIFQNAYDPDHRGLNKYEFIASKLGILGNQQESISLVLSKILTSLTYPCMIGAYIEAVFFLEHEELELSGNQDVDMLCLGLVGSLLTKLFLSTCAEYLDTYQNKASRFHDVIANWPAYKTETPEEFHQIFDELYQQYLKNNNHVDVSEDFINEIFTRVAAACVHSFLLVQQTQE